MNLLSCNSISIISIQKVLICFTVGLLLIFCRCFAQVDSSIPKCYKLEPENLTEIISISEPCKKKFTQRCGWFSLSYCTFYRTAICDSTKNGTYIHYRKNVVCCPGWMEGPAGQCIKTPVNTHELNVTHGKNASATMSVPINTNIFYEDPDYKPVQVPLPNKDDGITELFANLKLSHGAYAGIACAVIFILAFTTMTVLGVRKRRRRRAQKSSFVEVEMADQQMVLNPDL